MRSCHANPLSRRRFLTFSAAGTPTLATARFSPAGSTFDPVSANNANAATLVMKGGTGLQAETSRGGA